MPASANPAITDAPAIAAIGPGIFLTRSLVCDHMNEPDERGTVAPEGSSDLLDATEIPIRTRRSPGAVVEDDNIQSTCLRLPNVAAPGSSAATHRLLEVISLIP